MHTLDTFDTTPRRRSIPRYRPTAEASTPAMVLISLNRLVAWVQRELRIRRDLARLAEADEHLLADVALTRSQIADAMHYGHPLGRDRSKTGYSPNRDVRPGVLARRRAPGVRFRRRILRPDFHRDLLRVDHLRRSALRPAV